METIRTGDFNDGGDVGMRQRMKNRLTGLTDRISMVSKTPWIVVVDEKCIWTGADPRSRFSPWEHVLFERKLKIDQDRPLVTARVHIFQNIANASPSQWNLPSLSSSRNRRLGNPP